MLAIERMKQIIKILQDDFMFKETDIKIDETQPFIEVKIDIPTNLIDYEKIKENLIEEKICERKDFNLGTDENLIVFYIKEPEYKNELEYELYFDSEGISINLYDNIKCYNCREWEKCDKARPEEICENTPEIDVIINILKKDNETALINYLENLYEEAKYKEEDNKTKEREEILKSINKDEYESVGNKQWLTNEYLKDYKKIREELEYEARIKKVSTIYRK